MQPTNPQEDEKPVMSQPTSDEELREQLLAISESHYAASTDDTEGGYDVMPYFSLNDLVAFIKARDAAIRIDELEGWLPVAAAWARDEEVFGPLNQFNQRIGRLKIIAAKTYLGKENICDSNKLK